MLISYFLLLMFDILYWPTKRDSQRRVLLRKIMYNVIIHTFHFNHSITIGVLEILNLVIETAKNKDAGLI